MEGVRTAGCGLADNGDNKSRAELLITEAERPPETIEEVLGLGEGIRDVRLRFNYFQTTVMCFL